MLSAYRSQAYGMTETNSVSVAFTGDDYTCRPTSTSVSTFYPFQRYLRRPGELADFHHL